MWKIPKTPLTFAKKCVIIYSKLKSPTNLHFVEDGKIKARKDNTMRTFSLNPDTTFNNINFEIPKDEEGHDAPNAHYVREWMGEVWEKAVDGKLKPGTTIPNMVSYGFGCSIISKYKSMETDKWGRRKYEELIEESDLEQGHKGIVLDRVEDPEVQQNLCTYDTLPYEEEEFYKYNLNQFIDMRDLIFREHNVDFAILLLDASRLLTPAIEKVRELKKVYVGIDELITSLIQEGTPWFRDLTELSKQPILDLD